MRNVRFCVNDKKNNDKKQLDVFMTETLKTLEEVKKTCPGKVPIFEDAKF